MSEAMIDQKTAREVCFLCQKREARLIDPPDDIETFPGVPRWVCGFCGNFWIPSDDEIKRLGIKVPNARERQKWSK